MSYSPNNPNGSAVSASSAPVVIASDQLAISTKDTVIAGLIPTVTFMQNAAVALGNGLSLNVQGYVSALISVTGTIGAGTAITFEASVDDTTFVAITAHQIGFAGNLTTVTISTGDFRFSCAAYKSIRARISTYTTGTITAKGYSSPLAGHPTTVNSNIIASLPIGTNAIGTFGTTSAVINVGQKIVATTATQISVTSTVPTNGIIIQALSTNTASIFIGGSGVTTTTGFELTAGQSMSFTANLNTLYIISVASTTDKICWNVE